MHNERGYVVSTLDDAAGVKAEMRHKTNALCG